MVKHDESKDLNSLKRVCRVDFVNKTLSASKSTVIGIKRWGKIDYLTHYCGWVFLWDNAAVASAPKEEKETKRDNKGEKEKKFIKKNEKK